MLLKLFKTSLSAFFLLSSISIAFAQTSITPSTPWGTWFIGTVQLPGGPKKWGGFAEVQARTNGLFSQYFYNELKGGVSYDLDKNFTVMLAGGRYATYDYKAVSEGTLTLEKRFWEQLIINQYLARVKFEHRYRVEQRWLESRDGTISYRNRIRYRLNGFLPINQKTVSPGAFFLSVYDEIFLNPKGPTFERNRLYAGLGYQFSKSLIVQAGWVNQTNYNPATFNQGVFTPISGSGKNNLVLNLTYRINRHKGKATSPAERLPSQPD
ncbi:DUF2490 domain-containing protein [Arsenicibacter rosenii]|uniref:DUF2490 domain-containing protein n=1 Tax=Arsenicibacter rosenii TaxID=1750698 RepID=UPI000B0D2AF0|nr:DUF2490 domain-containing protein [Arsenicibacter rosenii]